MMNFIVVYTCLKYSVLLKVKIFDNFISFCDVRPC